MDTNRFNTSSIGIADSDLTDQRCWNPVERRRCDLVFLSGSVDAARLALERRWSFPPSPCRLVIGDVGTWRQWMIAVR